MPLFYFDLLSDDGSLVEDADGQAFANLEAVEREAKAAAREMIGQAIRHDHPVPAAAILIRNDHQEIIATISLDTNELQKRLRLSLFRSTSVH